MLISENPNADIEVERSALMAAFACGQAIDGVAACALLSIDDAAENDRRHLVKQCADLAASGIEIPAALQDRLDRANNARALANPLYRPAMSVARSAHVSLRERKKSPPTVTGSFLATAPKSPAMTDAEARKLLLTEIADRRGGAAAYRCRHMSVPQLASQLGSMKATPARQAEIGRSWDATLAKRGVEVMGDTKARQALPAASRSFPAGTKRSSAWARRSTNPTQFHGGR